MAKYFNKVKHLVDSLSSIGNPLPDDEIVRYLLSGLDTEYDPVVASISTRPDSISLNDAYAHLVNFEMHIEH